MNFVILEFSKTKHNLYNNLDYLGLNPYEQRHFCFHGGMGDPGGGEGSEAEGTGGGVDPGGEEEAGYDIGFSSAAQEASAAAAAAAAAAGDGQQDMGPMGWALDPFTQDLFAGMKENCFLK